MTDEKVLKEEDLDKATGGNIGSREWKDTTCFLCGVMDWQVSNGQRYYKLKNSDRNINAVEWKCQSCNGTYYTNYFDSSEKFHREDFED